MKTLFNNAIFHTMEDPQDTHHSMTVEHGKIIAFDEQPGEYSRIVDLGGTHVYPALIDAHLHLLETIALSGVGTQICRIEHDGVEPSNLAGIEKEIRAHAARVKPGSLIVFSNYISAAIAEKRLPTRFELDQWTDGARVWVLNIDGHSSSCSSALLEALDFMQLAPDGILAGPAHDANMGALSDYLASSVTPGIFARGIADFCNECASYGIGTVCAMAGTDDLERDGMTELGARIAQRLPLDIRFFPQYFEGKKLDAVLPRMGKKRIGGCMAWELDGSIGSRTAAFSRPYTDGSRGSLYFDDEDLRQIAQSLAEQGFIISAHAIGELAIEQIVSIFEDLPGKHRIDHCEFPSPQTLERIYKLKPYVTIQPGYAWIDKRYLHGYEHFLDEDIVAQQIPLKDFAANEVVLCGSSDSPVQSVDPFLQMRGMREFYVEDQSLSAFEALKTYTVNGGIMLDEEKGILREGYEASFFTTKDDLLEIEPCKLENMRAKSLYMHGKEYQPLPRSSKTLAHLLIRRPRKI